MYMSKLFKLNYCLEGGKGIFTRDQLKRINHSLINLPLAIADAAYEVDDYISELFYVVLSRYCDLSPTEKAKIATICIRNLFINNLRAKQIQFKYSYAMKLIAEGDYNRFVIENDFSVLYNKLKESKDYEIIRYIDEMVHILLYEDQSMKKKDISKRLGISSYKLRKLQTQVRDAYEQV